MEQESRKSSSNTTELDPKVVLIGIDSATWHVIMPLVQTGKMPNFSRLMQNGAYGPIRTLVPTFSPVIWGTILTGKSAQAHGIKTFTALKMPMFRDALYDYRWEQLSLLGRWVYRIGRLDWWKRHLLQWGIIKSIPLSSRFRRCKALWNIASDAGRTVGFLSWWNTWPAEPVNGYMASMHIEHLLTAPTASLEQATYPPHLLDEAVQFLRTDQRVLEQELGRFLHLSDREFCELATSRYKSDEAEPEKYPITWFLKLAYLRQEYRAAASVHFYKEYHPDLVGVFLSADEPQHFFWHAMEPQHFEGISEEEITRYGDVIPNWYVYLDGLMGKILAEVDESATVVVVSDHGHGPSGKLPWSGQHEEGQEGIILLSGDAVRSGILLEGASVFDVTPTVLALMGLPVAQDMEGRVLSEAITPQFLERYPVRMIDSYERGQQLKRVVVESEVDQEVVDRLRNLGYIE